MTQEEVIKCLSVLKINYSTFAKGLSQKDADNLIELWMVSFADYPYEVVSRAVYDLIGTKKDLLRILLPLKREYGNYALLRQENRRIRICGICSVGQHPILHTIQNRNIANCRIF